MGKLNLLDKKIQNNNTEMVEIENEIQQTHTLKFSFKNAKDSDYIEKLVHVPKLFHDFKIWMDGKL